MAGARSDRRADRGGRAAHVARAGDAAACSDLPFFSLFARDRALPASLEEAAASMEELTSTVSRSADNANEANQLVTQAEDLKAAGSRFRFHG